MRAFQDLKKYLVSTLVLSSSEVGEDLFMYLAVSGHVVSTILLKDQGGV